MTVSPRPLWLIALAAALLGPVVPAEATAQDHQAESNVPVSVTLTAREDHPDPFHTVTLDAVFTTPSGRTLRVPAFWLGGRSWQFRYASGELGIHRWRTDAHGLADPGLDGFTGEITVVGYVGTNPLYRNGPIRVSANRRRFEHADGTPFFWLGDTWWMGLCHRLRFPDEFTRLADDRVGKGFNVVQIVAGLYPDMPPFDPRGANEAGFPWEADYRAIRPEYFDAVDRRLQALVDRGITPCVVGMWGYFLKWMGPEKAKAHWRYLIARYGAWPVVWCVAGEANLPWYQDPKFPYDDRDAARDWTPIVRYVRDTDPFRRPTTIHPTALNEYTARHAMDDATLLDFDLLQTPHGTRAAAETTLTASRQSYAARPTMPVIDGEASYERLNPQITDRWARAMFWINMASGAAGHTYGANGIWQCNRQGQPHGLSPTGGTYGPIPWDEAMDLPGSTQLGMARKFLLRYPWHTFEPHPEWVRPASGSADLPYPAATRWIWHAGDKDPARDAPVAARFFRKVFTIDRDQPAATARLLVGADDRWTAWLDGQEVGSGTGWVPEGRGISLGGRLAPGRHVLAIRAENMAAPVPANPAGLLAALRLDDSGTSPGSFVTDASWRSSPAEVAGWRDPGFDDAAWTAASDLGPVGTSPWGPISGRKAFPPLAFGRADGVRIIYSLDPNPVVVSGLTTPYRTTTFNPATGETGVGVVLGGLGEARILPPPGVAEDWVLVLTPAPAP